MPPASASTGMFIRAGRNTLVALVLSKRQEEERWAANETLLLRDGRVKAGGLLRKEKKKRIWDKTEALSKQHAHATLKHAHARTRTRSLLSNNQSAAAGALSPSPC